MRTRSLFGGGSFLTSTEDDYKKKIYGQTEAEIQR